MRGRRVSSWTAMTLSIVLALPGLPATAGAGSIRGTVLSATDQSPLAGMTVFAADAATGEIRRSTPSDERGSFEIDELNGSTFELAVSDDRHLYVVASPVSIGEAGSRQVNLAVNAQNAEVPGDGSKVAPRPRIWNNPLTASLVVVGSAIVVGALINSATDDEDDIASPN